MCSSISGSGWLSDKMGRRKPFVIGSALVMALALIIGGRAAGFNQFIVAWMVFAVGQAMYLTVDLALCAQVLPNEADTGKDMAVFGLALNLPTILVPAAAPAILGDGQRRAQPGGPRRGGGAVCRRRARAGNCRLGRAGWKNAPSGRCEGAEP